MQVCTCPASKFSHLVCQKISQKIFKYSVGQLHSNALSSDSHLLGFDRKPLIQSHAPALLVLVRQAHNEYHYKWELVPYRGAIIKNHNRIQRHGTYQQKAPLQGEIFVGNSYAKNKKPIANATNRFSID